MSWSTQDLPAPARVNHTAILTGPCELSGKGEHTGTILLIIIVLLVIGALPIGLTVADGVTTPQAASVCW